jgi:uncharacterized membrane protein
MKKFTFNKKHIIVGYSIIFVISLVIMYFSFLGSVSDVSADEMGSINSLQNVITQIHKEDSNLYRILLSGSIVSSEILNNLENQDDTNSVISNLINLKTSDLFTSQKLASTIDDYYSITNIRMEIIELYKAGDSFDEIDEMLELYENNIEMILSDVESEMKYISEYRFESQKNILMRFIVFEIVLLVLFLVFNFKFSNSVASGSCFGATTKFDLKSEEIKENSENKLSEISEDMIMDSDSRKILEFIGSETSRGSFPTFKDLKSHLGLSHPTVLSKVNDLESRKLIGIRKQGRNKHLFLR